MDYEKKYNEALEKIRKEYDRIKYLSSTDARDMYLALREIFPELKESEDERIRKAIVEALNSHCNSINILSARGYQMEDIEAWLEKQGEQKPAEWSKEDEHRRKDAIYFLESAKRHYADTSEIEKSIDWLKSLPERFNLQPKQNVNDMITPNKKFFQWIYDRLVNVHNEDPNVDYMLSFKRRIEELPVNEPSWKPSEEQMDTLQNAVTLVAGNKVLAGLYEQLKKL